jgi:hypothetical protein
MLAAVAAVMLSLGAAAAQLAAGRPTGLLL